MTPKLSKGKKKNFIVDALIAKKKSGISDASNTDPYLVSAQCLAAIQHDFQDKAFSVEVIMAKVMQDLCYQTKWN